MKTIRNKRWGIFSDEAGIALVMILVLSVITLAVIAGLIYMITIGTQVSGIQKRYNTALESGLGGADITYKLISLRGDTTATNSFLTDIGLSAVPTTPVTCTGTTTRPPVTAYTGLEAKLMTSTTAIDGTLNWSGCNSSLIIDPGVATTYDMTFTLGTVPLQYAVYSKIVDTVEGNSPPLVEELKGCTGVVCQDPGIQVMSFPYLYTVEIDAENSTNPAERAKLSILYQY